MRVHVVLLLGGVLSACGPGLAARYETGNRALSTDDGAFYFLRISPALQRALNDCIPAGTPGASPVLVLVADVDADGVARNLVIEPESPGTDCVAQRLTATPLPKPTLAPGAESFPIGLRIETK